MTRPTAVSKYLQHYAEPEVADLIGLNDFLADNHTWSDVVVIPACNENNELLREPPPSSGRSLMILVINQTASASESVTVSNQALFTAATGRFERVWVSGCAESDQEKPGGGLTLLKDHHANRDILLVDKFSPGCQLPPKGGVGNARKVGADLATGLMQSGRITSQWIRCTDADVVMPSTYFSCTKSYANSEDISALIYPFRHGVTGQNRASVADVSSAAVKHCDDVVLATQLYELSLHYYVAAFKSVHSPYAFHTIGSTIAIDVEHYAKVRGFPKREAGEDFYLLNKLSKSGKVFQMRAGKHCLPIEIKARLSDRVPFGTGAAVGKMTALNNVVHDYRFYDPRLFGLLGLWLKSWPSIWLSKSCELQVDTFTQLTDIEWLNRELGNHEAQCLLDNLRLLKTEAALAHAFKQSKTMDQFVRQLSIWFDAFRSLKLIHALRDQLLPSISLETLSSRTEFLYLLNEDEDLNQCYSRL